MIILKYKRITERWKSERKRAEYGACGQTVARQSADHLFWAKGDQSIDCGQFDNEASACFGNRLGQLLRNGGFVARKRLCSSFI